MSTPSMSVCLTAEECRVVAGWVSSSVPMYCRGIEWFELDFEHADSTKARALLAKLGVLAEVLARPAR
jgi:hypothetical protein